MFGSEMLEIAIGMAFVFLLVSVICTAVREGLEGWLKTRAAYLEHGVRELLHDTSSTGLAKSLYEHPLIYSLYDGRYTPAPSGAERKTLAKGGNLPSYIPKKNFALALMDLAARGPAEGALTSGPGAGPLTPQSIRANISNIRNPAVQRVLLTALDAAGDDLEKVRTGVENWFDSGMDRVSGWYKRSTQLVLFITGLVVAVLLNVNAITIADHLARNDTARQTIVARAGAVTKDGALELSDSAANRELNGLGLPLGWDGVSLTVPGSTVGPGLRKVGFVPSGESVGRWTMNDVLSPLLGWLMVAFAATLGAPFWFDLLNKFMVVRSTVKPHEKSPEEGSEDRQRPTPSAGAAGGEPATMATTTAATPVAAGGIAAPPGAKATGAAGSPPGDEGMDVNADVDADDEGCGATGGYVTPDEELPAAEGGVA